MALRPDPEAGDRGPEGFAEAAADSLLFYQQLGIREVPAQGRPAAGPAGQ